MSISHKFVSFVDLEFLIFANSDLYVVTQASGKESIIAGFYHEGYEEPLLMLMKRRGVHSGLVVKVKKF